MCNAILFEEPFILNSFFGESSASLPDNFQDFHVVFYALPRSTLFCRSTGLNATNDANFLATGR